jgi:hypothetical protein
MEKTLAWCATLFCSYLAAFFAIEWADRSPRIFHALALFAIAWAVLLPYYSPTVQSPSEILSAYQGLLMMLSGGLLLRERAFRGVNEPLWIERFQKWGLIFLSFLLVPHIVIIPNDPGFAERYQPAIESSVGTALTLIGYYFVGSGVKSITQDKKWRWLAIVLFVYALLEISWDARFSIACIHSNSGRTGYLPCETPLMDTPFMLAFTTAKLVTTPLYLWLVGRASGGACES